MPKDQTLQTMQVAVSLLQQGALDRSADLFAQVLKKEPENHFALHYLGVIEGSKGNLARAKDLIGRSLKARPPNIQFFENYAAILFQHGALSDAIEASEQGLRINGASVSLLYVSAITLFNLGRFHESLRRFDKLLSIQPNHVIALNERGSVLAKLQRLADALSSIEKALTLQSNYAEAHLNRGNVCALLNRMDQAVASFEQAVGLDPRLIAAWLGRGNAFRKMKRFDEAIASYEKALSLKTDLAEAYLGLGNVMYETKRHENAAQAYEKAVGLQPGLSEAWVGLGNALTRLDRSSEAFGAFDRAAALDPASATASLGRGNAFAGLRNYGQALAAYDTALSLDPNLARAWIARGSALAELGRHVDAIAAYDKALAIEPTVEALTCRASAQSKLKWQSDAIVSYEQAVSLDPNHPFLKGWLLHQKMLCCDWSGTDKLIADIEDDLVAGRPSAEPFGWQGITQSPRSLQLCAEIYNRHNFRRAAAFEHSAVRNHEKIRIGYCSGEFREHATSHLIVGLLEAHDKSRFEIFAFDNGWDDRSDIRKRISCAVGEMVNIRGTSDAAAFDEVRKREIDILVNLNGYFGEHRMALFSRRPSPVQLNYLGFPGTLGAPYIDYIIADKTVIPDGHRQFYDEKVVQLPHSYQPNDGQRVISDRVFTRAEAGLPERGFVFCCFNNNYKILPETFGRWIRILRAVEASVLWLYEDNATVAANLKKEAQKRGVDPSRIVFAPPLPLSDHLARHRLADLFLDTLPSNAHTTCSDALWARLPVLTLIGEAFPGRVAASLLKALDLAELVTETGAEYEVKAIELARNPEKLATIKDKLAANRLTKALFNTELYARSLERAFQAMYDRYKSGLPPDHISIVE